jgi:hypothetical protein
VVESGRAFLQGFSGGRLPHDVDPQAYDSDAAADLVFRRWYLDKDFIAATAEVRRSAEVERAAAAVSGKLDSLYSALTGEPPAQAGADTDDGSAAVVAAEGAEKANTLAAATAAPTDASLARKLFLTTYIKELLDCELNHPPTALAMANGLLRQAEPGAPAAAESLAACTVQDVKATLWSRLRPEDEAFMLASARWVWDQRFFSHRAVRGFGKTIGGALLREVVHDLAAAADARGGGPPLAVFSGHDYTILALLAALRLPSHPSGCIGFGSFMIFELWRDDSGAAGSGGGGSGRLSVTVRLCTNPFPHASSGKPTELVAVLEPVVEDVALSGLLSMVEKY